MEVLTDNAVILGLVLLAAVIVLWKGLGKIIKLVVVAGVLMYLVVKLF